MNTVAANLQNVLLRKNGEFIVKDQIIFQYQKAVTTQQVKALAKYLLGKRAENTSVEVKQLDKNRHIFLIAAQGVHSWGVESVAKLINSRPIPPPPPPIIPPLILNNTVIIQQAGLKNLAVFKSDKMKGK